MNEKDSRGKGANPEEPGPGAQRREPVFSDFDDDEAFEELDRDRDFASAYEAEDPEEEDDYDLDEDDEYDEDTDWQPLTPAVQGNIESGRSGGNPWDVPPADTIDEDDEPLKPVPRVSREGEAQEPVSDEYDDDEDWDEEEYEQPEAQQEYQDEGGQGWPVGLIIVAVVALALLAAGGYGVVQQRAATQAEIRDLQAALATAASPAEVAQTREALEAMEQDLDRQLATIETLTLENRRLTDTVAGLESQLAAQKSAAATKQAAPTAAAPKAKPAAKPTPPKPAAVTAKGDWFVNFSSYSQRSAAESWLAKIKPGAGKAVIQPVTSNGTTLYRLRVVGLADRSQAEKVAAQLQAAHGLPKLWVGTE